MTKTIEELLSESKELRLSFRKNDSAPVGKIVPPLPWIRDFYQVLAPVGKTVQDCILHWYLQDGPFLLKESDSVTVLIHGHNREGFCSAGTLCHVLGFNPKELTELPSHFNNSWKRFGYDER